MNSTSSIKTATTLLYVEDDNPTQEIIIQILRLKFPQITLLLAKNGQEGLDLYSKYLPDIIVTDVRMPVIDGISMAKMIKELNSDAHIIVLSAADETNYILKAIDIGINHYVLKPINIEQFIAALERCLCKIILREQLKQQEEYIRRMAFYDFLTGLPNRFLCLELIYKSLANALRHNRLMSFLYLDVNGFKHINDTLGHAVGDQILQAVSERLKIACGRDQDTVARWGGDEFIILLPDLDKPQEAVSVAEKILKAFDRPVIIPNHELSISLSIGISIFPEDGTDADNLIKNADVAMYSAKKKGRNQYHFFAGGDPQ